MSRSFEKPSVIRSALAVALAAAATLGFAAPASAGEKLEAATYPDMTTFTCRTNPLPIKPGQNLNLAGVTQTCPNAEKVSGPADPSIFGTNAQGYITRFKPSMVELLPGGEEDTPSVWDLHLHHVVWLGPDGPTYASGEEKTEVKMPQGYGGKVTANYNWYLNYMIHSLRTGGADRSVAITWEIDWVPATEPDIEPTHVQWLDVAGTPQIYPVFDAEKGYDANGDGDFVFPDEADEPDEPAYDTESGKISPGAEWTVDEPLTLVFGAGHLHPGGTHVDLQVARDRDGSGVAGDRRSEVRKLFRSNAKYYEPAGAVSWDVSMEATRPEWRVKLKPGDVVSIDTTYDVEKASWYESMGILPLAYTTSSDDAAKDPFENEAAVRNMYQDGGILTHGRLPENIDSNARDDLGLPDPSGLSANGVVPAGGIDIDGSLFEPGGFTATPGFSTDLMRPPRIETGERATFNNLDAVPGQVQSQQVWHSITSCKAPCNKGSGIGYPLANGPVKFDSGQLGYSNTTCGAPGAICLNGGVVTGSNTYTTPKFKDPGTYTYFCRIHPSMRGSIRVKEPKP